MRVRGPRPNRPRRSGFEPVERESFYHGGAFAALLSYTRASQLLLQGRRARPTSRIYAQRPIGAAACSAPSELLLDQTSDFDQSDPEPVPGL